MLLAVVLELSSPQPVSVPAALGVAVQAWLLGRIHQDDPALAARLHDDQGPRPYTCSDLIHNVRRQDGSVDLTPEDPCWLRFTALTEEMAGALERAIGEPCIDLVEGAPLEVRARYKESTEHSWAGRSSYTTLIQQHVMGSGPPPRQAELRFASPTLFRSHGQNVILPLPDLVFGSYFFRWNRFAPVTLPYDARRYARECVDMGRYRLQSAVVRYGRPYMGFVGRVCFDFRVHDERWMRYMQMLADYAFWCGTGYRTPTGLGQTQFLERAR